MLTIYSGIMGAGKSYGVVRHVIVPALEDGRVVVTNVPVEKEALMAKVGGRGEVRELPRQGDGIAFDEIPGGAVIVIDEAWQFWASGTPAHKMPQADKDFFAMVRHRTDKEGRSQQISLVTQDPSDLASYVRNRVARHYRITKLDHVGAANRYRVDIYKGASVEAKDKVGEQFGRYQAEIFALYRSHTLGEASGGIEGEKAIDRRGSILSHPLVRYGLPVALVVLVGGLKAAFDGFHEALTPTATASGRAAEPTAGPSPQAQHSVKLAGPVQPVAQVASAPAAAPVERISDEWRIVAEIAGSGRRFIVARSRGGLRRVEPGDCETRLGQTWCRIGGEWATPFSGQPLERALGLAPQEPGPAAL